MSKKYPDLKTKTSTRIAIWVIALAMAVGTIMTYVVIIIAQNNTSADPTQIAYEKYLKEQQERQAKLEEAGSAQDCASAQRENPVINIDVYKAEAFDKNVTELKVETLKAGEGELTTAKNCIDVNYKGWNTKGEVFDSGAYAVIPANGGVIQGWLTGLVGLQVGGIYKFIIPTEQAYGATGSGDKIPANEPLTFVIEVVSVV